MVVVVVVGVVRMIARLGTGQGRAGQGQNKNRNETHVHDLNAPQVIVHFRYMLRLVPTLASTRLCLSLKWCPAPRSEERRVGTECRSERWRETESTRYRNQWWWD